MCTYTAQTLGYLVDLSVMCLWNFSLKNLVSSWLFAQATIKAKVAYNWERCDTFSYRFR